MRDANPIELDAAEAIVTSAEHDVLGCLRRLPDVHFVFDERAARKPFDYLVSMRDGTSYMLDVKLDRHIDRTGNVCFELWNNRAGGSRSPGWGMKRNAADRFAVVGARSGIIRVYDMKAARAEALRPDRRHVEIWNPSGGYATESALVPMGELDEAGALLAMYTPLFAGLWWVKP